MSSSADLLTAAFAQLEDAKKAILEAQQPIIKHEQAIEALNAKHKKAIQHLMGHHETQEDVLRRCHLTDNKLRNSGHAASIERRNGEHAAELKKCKTDHAAELEKRDGDHASDISKIQSELKKCNERHAAEVSNRGKEHAAELKKHDEDHASNINKICNKIESENSKKRRKITKDLQDRLDRAHFLSSELHDVVSAKDKENDKAGVPRVLRLAHVFGALKSKHTSLLKFFQAQVDIIATGLARYDLDDEKIYEALEYTEGDTGAAIAILLDNEAEGSDFCFDEVNTPSDAAITEK